ncbi:HigA family addiction module antitoxin [Corynebacterium callunae]|uniref:Plasmid maintenance system antidote protein, XRE family n=1 Tax=Corynebacterium callunae DSM 20147 TaxID=1121353 RepID=M1V0J9_9CORY|nr:HigA family addiction module antitoxin [Corynebacterium callunae]AGG67828.1 Plasmid maintenance system antidote protein, XRE family [Corynebacterium callunae DSM 20147]
MLNGVSDVSGIKKVRIRSNSSTFIENELDKPGEFIEPIHPGEILMEDFITGFGITQNKLAVAIGVPPRRISEIVHGKRGVSADTTLRLARYFGTSAEMWMNLQTNYELRLERRALHEKIAGVGSKQ